MFRVTYPMFRLKRSTAQQASIKLQSVCQIRFPKTCTDLYQRVQNFKQWSKVFRDAMARSNHQYNHSTGQRPSAKSVPAKAPAKRIL